MLMLLKCDLIISSCIFKPLLVNDDLSTLWIKKHHIFITIYSNLFISPPPTLHSLTHSFTLSFSMLFEYLGQYASRFWSLRW